MKDLNCWVVRPNPDGNNRIEEFLNENIIGVGWPKISNLDKLDKKDIKSELVEKYNEEKKSQKNALHAGILTRFSKKMKKNDLVLIPEQNKLHIAQITSNYKYNQDKKDKGYPHIREVNWLKTNIKRENLPSEIQNNLKARLTLYSINKNYDSIINYITDNISIEKIEGFSHSYENLKEAIYMEIRSKYSFISKSTSKIYKLAKKSIEKTTIKKAREIAEKSKIFFGNNKWKGQYLYEPEHEWFDFIINLIENNNFEEKVQKEKQKLYSNTKKELLNSLDESFKENKVKILTDKMNEIYEEGRIELFDDLISKIVNEKYDNLIESNKDEKAKFLLKCWEGHLDYVKEKLERMIEAQKGPNEKIKSKEDTINFLKGKL